jgi:hypothetical protein
MRPIIAEHKFSQFFWLVYWRYTYVVRDLMPEGCALRRVYVDVAVEIFWHNPFL